MISKKGEEFNQMKDIGNFLRESREAKGISLIEVEKDLKIRKKYLQALEEGNVDVIPSKTYIVGYLRNYSKYLDIDEDNIIFEGILFEGEEYFWETDQSLEIITEYPTKIETYYDDESIEISKGTIDNYLLKYNFNPAQNI